MLGCGPTNPLSPGLLLFCSSSCLSHVKLPVAHRAEGCWAFWLWGHCIWKQSSNIFFWLNDPLSSFLYVWIKMLLCNLMKTNQEMGGGILVPPGLFGGVNFHSCDCWKQIKQNRCGEPGSKLLVVQWFGCDLKEGAGNYSIKAVRKQRAMDFIL